MFQTLGLSQHELQNNRGRLSVQGCFVDAQVFFPITTFPTLSNAPKVGLTFPCQFRSRSGPLTAFENGEDHDSLFL
jgi:hypothetical protein